MATTEEIEQRVQQADAARSTRRAAAARQVSELAERRAVLAEQLDDIERELGDVLAAVRDVMDVDELAAFTDLPAADLTRWLTARTTRKPTRTSRQRPAVAGDAGRGNGNGRSRRATTPTPKASPMPAPAEPRASSSAVDEAARVPVDVA
jgi:hypothetical protein